MPPRKRAKARAASTPLAESQPKTPVDTGPTAGDQSAGEDAVNDPWTDDQESLLFQNLIRYKPTGMHKHFRMLSIANDLRSHGYASSTTAHTRIPGIWAKLDQLYDLETLDERENVHAVSLLQEEEQPEFELPEDDFGDLMWTRRFPPSDAERSSSPEMPDLQFSRDDPPPVSIEGSSLLANIDKEEAESLESPPAKGRGRPARNRASRKSKGTPAGRNSKAQSAVSESAEDEDEDEEKQGSGSEEEAQTTRGSRSSRKGQSTRRSRK